MHIYFHEDFDGCISAVLAAKYFHDEHNDHNIYFHPVNYNMKYWESTALKSPSCVVDFKYHPNCDYWFDHHHDAGYEAEKIREQYSDKYKLKEQKLYCDPEALSCASLIRKKLFANPKSSFAFSVVVDLAHDANYIDNAKYLSAHEACFGQGIANRLNRIIVNKTYSLEGICHGLLSTLSIDRVLHTEEFIEAHQDAWLLECKDFINYMESDYRSQTNLIAEYDMLNLRKSNCNRYLPFWEFPSCEYAVGLTGKDDQIRITISKNPWNTALPRLHVGSLCKRLGGGGHAHVGSVRTDSLSRADDIYDEIINELNVEGLGSV